MSGQQLLQYRQKRERIVQALSRIQGVAEALRVPAVAEALNDTIEDVRQERFKVVVVGEFSRGKSTFINALLGRRILPSSPVPTTTILNKIVYADQPDYLLMYREAGRAPERVDETAFQAIVAPEEAEEGDDRALALRDERLERIAEIAYAEIGYPTELCGHGVEIVDTPGTNDLDAAREEITYRFIPQSDAAIIVLSGRMPLAETEMHFIRDRIIASDIKKMFFVVNFKDALKTEADRVKVMAYIDEHIRNIVPEPRLFLLSAKQALAAKRRLRGENVKGEAAPLEQTGYPEFEEALATFLARDQGPIKLLKPADRGVRMAAELQANHIRLLLGTMTLGVDELEKRLALVRAELERARRASDETLRSFRTNLTAAGQGMREELANGLHDIANSAVRTVTNYQGALEKNEIARAVEGTVAPLQTSLQDRLRQRQTAILEEEFQRANRKLQYEWDAIEAKIVESLSLQASTQAGDGELQVSYDEGEVVVKTGLGSLGLFGLIAGFHIAIPFALPALFFGGSFLYTYFQNKMRERVLGEARVQIEKRYRDGIPAAVASYGKQWDDLTDRAEAAFRDEIRLKLDSIAARLAGIEAERAKEASVVEARKRELASYQAALEDSARLLQETANELRSTNG